jgi:hypothetical protein
MNSKFRKTVSRGQSRRKSVKKPKRSQLSNRLGMSSAITSDPFWVMVLVIVVLAIFAPMTYHKGLDVGLFSDFDGHNQHVAEMIASRSINDPHFLFHLTTAAVFFLTFEQDIATASIIVVSLCWVALALLLYCLIRDLLVAKRLTPSPVAVGAMTLGLMVCAPINELGPLDGHFYFGYVHITVYHNPTMAFLKPLALAQFFDAARIFRGERAGKWAIARLALLTVLGALAKPSLLICLLPGAVLFAAYSAVRRRPVDYRLLLLGLLVPAVGILAWQYQWAFGAGAEVLFSPFTVYSFYSSMLIPKFVLSILFPLSVLILYRRAVARDVSLVFSWIVFICASLETYLLAESGNRMLHGNFAWSGQIALFILFVTSALFLIEQNPGLLCAREKSIREADSKTANTKNWAAWWSAYRDRLLSAPQMGAAARRSFVIIVCVLAAHVWSGWLWYFVNWLGPRSLW